MVVKGWWSLLEGGRYLYTDHGEDEEEEDVDDEDVEHIFEGDHNTVEHSLERGNTIHHLEGSKHAKQLHRLQLLTHRSTPEIWLSSHFILNITNIFTFVKRPVLMQ